MNRTPLIKAPFVFWDIAEIDSGILPFPVLESASQPGWELVREVRLTNEESSKTGLRKIAKVATVVEATYGFGILKQNPFFAVVGMYRKIPNYKPAPAVEFLDADDNPALPTFAQVAKAA